MSDSFYPIDCSMPGSSVHGILQAGILEYVAISFSRESSQPRNWTQVSCIAGWFFTDWAMREAHSLCLSTCCQHVFITVDVNLDHLVEVLFVSFVHCNVLLYLLSYTLWKKITMHRLHLGVVINAHFPWGCSIYVIWNSALEVSLFSSICLFIHFPPVIKD